MVSLEKELEFVDTYFHIEEARFGNKIKLVKKIEIPLSYQLPVLMLQPLVENAVRHGISKKLDGGTVYLSIVQSDGNLEIEIRDDGIGMNVEKLATIFSEDRIEKGVGIVNINNRLQRLYGNYLAISSELGIGTCVKILFAKEEK